MGLWAWANFFRHFGLNKHRAQHKQAHTQHCLPQTTEREHRNRKIAFRGEDMNTAEKLPPIPLPDLVTSLEQATFMAKQLPITTDPNHLLRIYSSLHHTHNLLSSFLSKTQFPLFPPAPSENSDSSATAGPVENDEEPMQMGDDEGELEAEAGAEDQSNISVDKVEERMRDVFIKNKRPKRPLSPSSAAVREERKAYEDGYAVRMKFFDPHETKLRALELVYQFHG